METAVTTNLHLAIDGMHCEACVRRVSQALSRALVSAEYSRVTAVSIGSAEVEASSEAVPALLAAMEKAGYQARLQD